MVAASRIIGTAAFVACLMVGAHSFVSIDLFLLIFLISAWGAAWFGDDLRFLTGIGSDSVSRMLGVSALIVTVGLLAAFRWGWVTY